MSAKKPNARVVDKERAYDFMGMGKFVIDVYTIEMDKHNGGSQELKRLVFERGHAVAMLGYDPVRDEVLLVNEMRPGMLAAGENPFNDATPAGMIDKGENALQAAKREMLEETGMRMRHARVIHSGAFVSSGGSSEKIALVVGIVDMTKAGGIHGHVSEGEDIKTVIQSSQKFIDRAEKAQIKDMKSLVFAYWLALHRDELRDKYGVKKDAKPQKKSGASFKK